MKSKINSNAAPQAKRLCGAMKRAALALLLCVLTTMTAWAENVTLTSSTTTWMNGNTYILSSDVTITEHINVYGNVTLQLGSGYMLTSTKGISVEYDDNASTRGVLTITGDGTLDIPADDLDDLVAGISVNSSSELHIEGGIVRAHAGRNAPGIGVENVFISGGTVDAWGGDGFFIIDEYGTRTWYGEGSAIGASGTLGEDGLNIQTAFNSPCGNITISGGTVNLHGDLGEQYLNPNNPPSASTRLCVITITGGTISIDPNYFIWCRDLNLDYNETNNFSLTQQAGSVTWPNCGNVNLNNKPFLLDDIYITSLNNISDLKGRTLTPFNTTVNYYNINCYNPNHGTVKTQISGVNTNKAHQGQVVTVVATPEANYQLESITVTGATLNSDNTFTMPASNVSVTATFTYFPTPWSGNGTASDPFIIHTVSDLQDLATNVNNGIPYAGYYFKQDADIDCSGYGMTPIGDLTNAHPFKGNYNGQNNKIINYHLAQAYLLSSLFGHTEDATLTNIVMQNCNIDARSYNDSHAAGICASCGSGTTISNCRVTGTIKGEFAAGGIVAAINDANVNVSNCFADVTLTVVDANGYRGKIYAGTSAHATTSGCYYHDNSDGVGGCGYDGGTAYSDTEIAPVYTVTASNGLTLAATNVTITHNGTRYFVNGTNATLNVSDNNYSIVGTPTVSGTGATYTLAADRKSMTVTVGTADVTVNATVRSISGTCGTNATWSLAQDGNGDYTLLTISGTGAVQNYSQNTPAPWGNAITIANVGDGITGIGDYAFANCSSLQRVNINNSGAVSIGSNTFSGCTALQYIVFPSIDAEQQNITGNWEAYATKRRAQFGSQHFAVTTETGTAVYAIATEQDLRNLSTAVNGGNNGSGQTFRQTADITLNGSFTPIGIYINASSIRKFSGTYDGGDNTISGLNISGNHQYAGLFGQVDIGGTVKNVRLVNPSVTSSSSGAHVAALIGGANQCTVQNCLVVNPTVSATASSNKNEVGVLFGDLANSTVQNCIVISPTVSGEGTNYVGVICGYAFNGGPNIHCTLTNVYYYNSSLGAIGSNNNGSYASLTNVGCARKVTLGSGMANVSPEATNMANGFVYDNESYYREGLALTLTDNLGIALDGYTKHYYANGTDLNGTTYTVSSTDGDVTFTADCRSDGQQHEVTYVDAQGESHTTNAIPLDGTMTTLNGTYYVGANITFTSTITLNGNTNIILANGKTMNVGTSDNRIPDEGIKGSKYRKHTLTIYGQSLDEATAGHLSIYNNDEGINLDSYNQQSGNVTVNSTTYNYTIGCNSFTLSGGKLNAINNHTNGLGITGDQIRILGGQLDTYVSNNGYALTTLTGSITLGWTNATDHIYASRYDNCTINIASGQVFVTNDPTPDTITGNGIDESRINGKTLRPILTGSGTTDDPYLISNAGGWDLFCDLIENSTSSFTDNVKLCANISVSRMAGSESKPFCGHFDGQDYTITFNYNTGLVNDPILDYIAPFRYVKGSIGNAHHHATISNLYVDSHIIGENATHLAGLIANQKGLVDVTNCHVQAAITSTATTDSYCAGLVSHADLSDNYGNAYDGTLTISGCTVSGSISTYGKYAGGFVGMAEGKTSIENSVSGVTIHSFVSGNGTHGGFIGLQQNTMNYTSVKTTIEGCLFNGKLITSNGTTNCGGFIGWHNGGSLDIKYCLYAPADIESGETEISDSYTFVGNGTVGDNCIYTRTLGTAQGKATHSITAGNYVAISNMALINFLSNPDVYNVSGITSYDWDGISCGGNLYICEGAHVRLVLSNNAPDVPTGFFFGYIATNGGNLEDNGNGNYTLTMPDADVIINVDTDNPIPEDWANGTYTGTESDPYMIYNKDQLDLLASRVNNPVDEISYYGYIDKFFKLGADIVYNPDELTIDHDGNDTNESNYTSIGCIEYLAFQGTFDGDGHTISGIRNINNGGEHQGLFGYVSYYGTVKNVILADALITGPNRVGGLVGENDGTIKDNLVIGATIPTATDNSHGAICGSNNGTLERNYYVGCTVAGVENATSVGCGYIEDGDDYITADITDDDGAVPGNVLTVKGHGGNNQAGWVFIASPVAVDGGIAPNNVTNLVATPAENYDLYRFNQSAEAEWENYKAMDGNNQPLHADFTGLVNGQGYLYANRHYDTLSFIGTTYNTAVTQEVPLVYETTNSDPLMYGWNLVGNPFPRAAYITNMSYYKMMTADNDSSYISATPAAASDYISPCTGVMVQATGENQSVIFSTTLSAQQNAANNGNLNIALSQTVNSSDPSLRGGTTKQSSTIDNAIVSFNEGSQLGKFYFGTQNANIYLPQDGEEYAIVSVGRDAARHVSTMPVNFKANENGQYTLTVNPEGVEMIYLHLIDNMNGNDVDLLEMPSYTFTATTTDYESRFKLVFASKNEDGTADDSETFAFYNNGNWIITNEGQATLQVIDIMGRILSSETVNGSVSKAINQPAGVYMIRLINGENAKVQKIVVR